MSPLVSGSPAASSRSTSRVTASVSRRPAGFGVRPMAARRFSSRSRIHLARIPAGTRSSGSGPASCQRSSSGSPIGRFASSGADAASMMWAVWFFPSRLSPVRGDASVGGKGDICLEVFVLTIGVSLVTPLEVSPVTPLASLSGFRGVILTPLDFGLFPPFSRGVILTPLNLSAFPACSALPSPSRSARSARSALACRPGFSDTCSRVTFMQHSQTTDRYGSGT